MLHPYPSWRGAAFFIEFDHVAKVMARALNLFFGVGVFMPRGDKSSYTDKQKRQAEHIEEGYEKKGVSKKESEGRAWATVNATAYRGKKSGSGRGKSEDHVPERKGGHKGGSHHKMS